MTPNYFRLNYNHGRTHSGMIAYLVELWNAGKETREPLRQFLAGLGVKDFPPHERYIAQLEYNNIDLAIWKYPYVKEDEPLLLLEMKVDDYQAWKKLSRKDLVTWGNITQEKQEAFFTHQPTTNNPYLIQTEMYTFRKNIHAKKPEDRPACLFVTLGTGEFKEEFNSPESIWKACGLRKFVRAVEAVHLPDDQLFQQWKSALQKELELRDQCWEEQDEDIISGERHQLATMMRLGDLRNRLLKRDDFQSVGSRPQVYKANTDTILNFVIPNSTSQLQGFRFCEINSNGRLNFKIYFHETCLGNKHEVARNSQVELYAKDLESLSSTLPAILQEPRRKKGGKSSTVRSLSIGLNKYDLTLTNYNFAEGMEEVLANITSALIATKHLLHYDK